MLWTVWNWHKTCENLVHLAPTIGELQHTKYLKSTLSILFKNMLVFPKIRSHMSIVCENILQNTDQFFMRIVQKVY